MENETNPQNKRFPQKSVSWLELNIEMSSNVAQNSGATDSQEDAATSSVMDMSPGSSRNCQPLEDEGNGSTLPWFLKNVDTLSIHTCESMICRICHNSEDPEKLVSPCLCKGSLTYVHLHCLERWISLSRCTTCELCQFQYNTQQTLRYSFLQSLRIWYSRSVSRRALQEDCQMFSLLTLVAFGIIGTLIVAVQHYIWQGHLSSVGRLWTKGWLVFFLTTTLMVYFINVYMIAKTQLAPWYRWWQSARDIRLILENHKPFHSNQIRRATYKQIQSYLHPPQAPTPTAPPVVSMLTTPIPPPPPPPPPPSPVVPLLTTTSLPPLQEAVPLLTTSLPLSIPAVTLLTTLLPPPTGTRQITPLPQPPPAVPLPATPLPLPLSPPLPHRYENYENQAVALLLKEALDEIGVKSVRLEASLVAPCPLDAISPQSHPLPHGANDVVAPCHLAAKSLPQDLSGYEATGAAALLTTTAADVKKTATKTVTTLMPATVLPACNDEANYLTLPADISIAKTTNAPANDNVNVNSGTDAVVTST